MRFLKEEGRLGKILGLFLKMAYPDLTGKPLIMVLGDEQFEKARGDIPAKDSFYNIPNEVIYIRFRMTWLPRLPIHEAEHWAQAKRVGKNRYIQELKDQVNWMRYEREAIDAEYRNIGLWEKAERELGR